MYLISYDIEGDNLRTKISDKLIAEGLQRIQYSVFLGKVAPQDILTLEQWLLQALQKGNPQKDTILIIHLTEPQVKAMKILGFDKYDKDLLIDKKSTLIL